MLETKENEDTQEIQEEMGTQIGKSSNKDSTQVQKPKLEEIVHVEFGKKVIKKPDHEKISHPHISNEVEKEELESNKIFQNLEKERQKLKTIPEVTITNDFDLIKKNAEELKRKSLIFRNQLLNKAMLKTKKSFVQLNENTEDSTNNENTDNDKNENELNDQTKNEDLEKDNAEL